MSKILAIVSFWILSVISAFGYFGVVFLMAVESANIPLPSEIIMPFSGYLVAQGRFSLVGVALAGGTGCLLGSIFSYALGYFGGRPLVERYGKYFLVAPHDLELGERWLKKYGEWVAFFSRLVPVVRTFISFPLGIARVNFWRFCLYSFVGSVIWSFFLAYLGQKLGENWQAIKVYFHGLDWLIAILAVLGVGYWIYRHLKHLTS